MNELTTARVVELMFESFANYPYIAIPIFVVVLWFVVTTFLRLSSGLSNNKIVQESGPVLSDSGWGSAVINLTRWKNCVKLVEYNEGFVLKVMPIFGGGKLWIPKGGYTIEMHKQGGSIFVSEQKKISCNGRVIRLYGRLAQNLN